MERWIVRHYRAITIGCIITGILIRVEFNSRGHFAIGGEWLAVPMCLMVGWMLKELERSRKRNARAKARARRISQHTQASRGRRNEYGR